MPESPGIYLLAANVFIEAQFQVPYLNTFEMLRALDVRFSWAP